jgi:hypothetical protein
VTLANGLKLYIVGERSGNPADWTIACNRVYVAAHDTEEALSISGMNNEPVAEIIPDEAMVLIVEKDDRPE